MKRFAQLAICSLIAIAATAPAHALTATSTFDVTANLTSKCEITVAPAPVVFTYTSFETAAVAATGGGFTMRCTNLLPYTLSVPAGGTLIGLAYTLGTSAAGGTGAGLTTASHSITGSMAANQSGDCAAGSCTATATHTLTITY